MDTQSLIEILQTRMETNDNNPTKGSFLYEIYLKMQKLKRFEDNEALSN